MSGQGAGGADRDDAAARLRARAREALVGRLVAEASVVGVVEGGSVLTGSSDRWSDLDLVAVVRDPGAADALVAVMDDVLPAAGRVTAHFTGEHVGEPRLVIALLEDPVLHVDVKVVPLPELAHRIEDPVVLADPTGVLAEVIAASPGSEPGPDLQRVEDRFWVWIHYAAAKIGRGELLEAVDFLAFLRAVALGPLVLESVGALPRGVRRVELRAPELVPDLVATVATPDRPSLVGALRAAVDLYRRLREAHADAGRLERRAAAESLAVRYLDAVEDGTVDDAGQPPQA